MNINDQSLPLTLLCPYSDFVASKRPGPMAPQSERRVVKITLVSLRGINFSTGSWAKSSHRSLDIKTSKKQ
jgi:hypothetical protein